MANELWWFLQEQRPMPTTHYTIKMDPQTDEAFIIKNFTECGFCRAIMHVQALYCGHCGKGRTH
ncbi:hypothetical protein SEA_ARGAN_77 [Arthrobacter phage Argan]|nr:hypothetical protein SEA_ARGAN_77 [Arthrobacter phage Argan]